MRLPKKLGEQPLVDATFEVRFDPGDVSISARLPGVVMSRLGETYGELEVLPLATMPKEFRDQQRELRYSASHRIHGDNAVVLFGDRVVGVSRLAPYEGWTDFRKRVIALLEVVENSGLVSEIERFSLKLVNILGHTGRGLDLLRLTAAIGDEELSDNGFRLRTQLDDENYVRIIEIVPNSIISFKDGRKSNGLKLSVDTIKVFKSEPGSWDDVKKSMDDLHLDGKSHFFQLLTDQTLESLQPEYDD